MISIRLKIVLIVTLVIGAFFVAITISAATLFRQHAETTLGQQARSAVLRLGQQLDHLLALGIAPSSLLGFEEQCREILDSYEHVDYAYISDLSGSVLFHSDPDFRQAHTVAVSSADTRLDQFGIQDVRIGHRLYWEARLPIKNSLGRPIAMAHAGIPVSDSSAMAYDAVKPALIYAFVLLLTGIALSLFLVTHFVSRPLHALLTGIQDITRSANHLEHRLATSSRDEIGLIALAFDEMMQRLGDATISREYLQRIMDGANGLVLVANPEGTITDSNQVAVDLLGYARTELIGRPLKQLVEEPEEPSPTPCPHDRHCAEIRMTNGARPNGLDRFTDLSGRHDTRNAETSLLTKEGRRLPTLLSKCFVGGIRGGAESVIISGVDISELKRIQEEKEALQQKLFQAQKLEAIGTLSGGIAHEVNNMLLPVLILTESAAADLPKGHSARVKLAKVEEAAQRIKSIVSGLLDFSRKEKEDKEAFSLDQGIKEALQLVRAGIPTTIDLRTSIGQIPEPIQCHKGDIDLIVINLVKNAADALEGEIGVIDVSLAYVELDADAAASLPPLRAGPHACLIVRDSGRGIDEEIQSKIFTPFFTTKKVGEGSGLGLSSVYGLVSSLEGKISIDSQIGSGAQFEVYLPLKEGGPLRDRPHQ